MNMKIVEITGLSGNSPYNISICDITLTNCYIVETGVISVPPTLFISLPVQLEGAQQIIIKVTDSIGCEDIVLKDCPLPSSTPTPTPTNTQTPTYTPTPTNTPTNTQTPTYTPTPTNTPTNTQTPTYTPTPTNTPTPTTTQTPTNTPTPTPTPTLPDIVKQFQNGDDFDFQDGDSYDFQDT